MIFILERGNIMKKKITAIVLILSMVFVMFALTGCGSSQLNRPTAEDPSKMVTVTGSCEAYKDGNNVVVEGECDLMTGTNGTVSVYSSDGRKLALEKIIQTEGEKISYTFPIEEGWGDEVYGFITFDTTQSERQPDAVREAYGKAMEYLEGDNVIWDARGIAVCFQSEAVDLTK